MKKKPRKVSEVTTTLICQALSFRAASNRLYQDGESIHNLNTFIIYLFNEKGQENAINEIPLEADVLERGYIHFFRLAIS